VSDYLHDDSLSDAVYGWRCIQRRLAVSLERRALVVDDDAGVRLLIQRILSANGFSVELARDGAEAIEKIATADYDVIILDLMMPRINGRTVVRYLNDHAPEELRKVIVMTAFGKSAIHEVCPPVGRHIEKPFDINHLLREVTECAWMSGAK
jgi:two-component system response regulator MprA